jgi:acetyl-CoA acetyltransferase
MVAIVGVGRSRVFRYDDVPLGVLAVEAGREAIDQAGLTVEDVDGLCCVPDQPFAGAGSLDGVNLVSNRFMARALGIDPAWAFDSSGLVSHSLVSAIGAVEAGLCEYALVFRGMHSPSGSYGHTNPREAGGQDQFVAPYGAFYPAIFGQIWQRYQSVHGTGSREQMAGFVSRSRRNALKNPRTYWASHDPRELSIDEYLHGRMVSEPLSIFDCDLPIQVAGAFLITSDDRARALERDGSLRQAAYVRGLAWSQPGQFAGSMVPTLEQGRSGGRVLADRFWRSARLAREDVNVLELYDGFSIFAPLWAETLGFCEEGAGFEFIDRVAMEGSDPLIANTSGGSLGGGRLHGMAQYSEAALQVMGEAGDRQVEDVVASLGIVGTMETGVILAFGKEPG